MVSKTVFLNDKFVPYKEAFVHIEDRGFQLADGVYEVILFQNNKLIDFKPHMDRLYRSAGELDLKIDKKREEFEKIFLKLFKNNNLDFGSIYVQVTRGSHPRIPSFPKKYHATINAISRSEIKLQENDIKNGFKAITHDDIRWKRCDIKSVSLLASTMLNEKAKNSGAAEAILIRDGFVTEGSFSNVFIINNQNQLITRPPSNYILQGITRNKVLDLAKNNTIEVIEEKFTKEDLLNAKEVFLTSSTLKIRPITQIDDNIIGSGKEGDITQKIRSLYENFCKNFR